MDSYDPKFNVKLKTYAEHRIRGAILDSIRGLDGVPVHKRKRLKEIEAAIAAAEQRLQRVPAEEEIAGELKIPLACLLYTSLVALSLFPGLPTIPFLALGSGLGFVGWRMRRKNDDSVKTSTDAAEKPAKENVEALLQVDPLTCLLYTSRGSARQARYSLVDVHELL